MYGFDELTLSFYLHHTEKDIFKPKVCIANKLNETSISSFLLNYYRKAHANIFAIHLGDELDSFIEEELKEAAEYLRDTFAVPVPYILQSLAWKIGI